MEVLTFKNLDNSNRHKELKLLKLVTHGIYSEQGRTWVFLLVNLRTRDPSQAPACNRDERV